MNPARATPEDSLQFLIGSPTVVSATEVARVQPDRPRARPTTPSPDLDKPRARPMGLVGHHWSGNHQAVVRGLNLITLRWTAGDRLYPCDYRVYHKAGDGKTENDHVADLLRVARDRGFRPRAVSFDGWHASVENLERVRDLGRTFVTRFKSNRKVRIDHGEAMASGEPSIPTAGAVVWSPGCGEVRVFRVVAPNGDTTPWATNDLGMDEPARVAFAELSRSIGESHRGLKPFTGVERCQVRYARGQRNHIGCAIRAFVRLEYHRFTTGISWFAAKWGIVREAVRADLTRPIYRLPAPATA